MIEVGKGGHEVMRQPVETGDRKTHLSPSIRARAFRSGPDLRGRHYGQRSCEPHQQVEHTAAPTSLQNVKKTLANGEPSTHGGKAEVSFQGRQVRF